MWYAVDMDAAPPACEAVEYALMEAGASGTEQRGPATGGYVSVAGYFAAEPQITRVRAALLDALGIYGLAPPSVRELSLREVEPRDWLGEWKKNWRAVDVGRFIVAPPWDEVEEAGGRIVLRIEPGMAFGTGTHETTRLCLAAIEKHFDGASFLDVGAGTGILAIAAARLRPSARVEACDTDADAVEIAIENARLNGVGGRVEFSVGSVEAATASADFVCANLTADVIVPLLPALTTATCGRLVLSGILAEQSDWVLASLRGLGVTNCEVERDGAWIAIIS
jgi:ribosomal protein L11 methyltransferase